MAAFMKIMIVILVELMIITVIFKINSGIHEDNDNNIGGVNDNNSNF